MDGTLDLTIRRCIPFSNIAPAEHVKATADSKIENNCGFRFAMHKNLAEFGNFTSLGFRKGGYELLREKRLQAL